ncbi:MAG TPA: hypothetical protein DD490_20665 [Acidobacteria bacterium]|nr:hypothetical protein [Acidobacteriota bacterium]
MTSTSFRRTVVLLVLAAFLAAPWLAAAEPAARAAQRNLGSPWDVITQLWSTLTATWDEAGCWADPYGGCAATKPEPEPALILDEGCRADPYGGCAADSAAPEPEPATLDAGCLADPYGGCSS